MFGSASYRYNSTIPRLRVTHAYEIRPRRDKRDVDLISDALPFGRLWHAYPSVGNIVKPMTMVWTR